MDREQIRFFLYGVDSCPFCNHAEDYFLATGTEYYYFNYKDDPAGLAHCKSFFQHETVPIIIINNKTTGESSFVGGYTDLMEHVEKND